MAKFVRKEFECKCGCGRNEINDKFLTRLNELGNIFPYPVIVSSGYRCPDHNLKVSNTGLDGPHTTGWAGDFLVSYEKAFQFLMAATRIGFTGIGVHQKGPGSSRFIHLDLLSNSPAHPRPRIWSY